MVDINPVQDLHGQDSPWPAGGGKNRLETTLNQTTESGVTYTPNADGTILLSGSVNGSYSQVVVGTISLDAGTYYIYSGIAITNVEFYISGVSGASAKSVAYNQFTIDTAVTNKNVYLYIPSGASVNNVTIKPMICLSSASNPTTYAPYENICPISGWTQVDVEQSGVNVWDGEWEVGAINPQNGNKSADASRVRSKNFIPCQPDTNYYYSCNSGTYTGNLCVLFYGADNNYLGYYDFNPNHLFTTPASCHYMMFYSGSAYGGTYNHDISINYPSTDHDYHPYIGRSITINLGQTVYGGKLDVLSGELTVDRAMVDLGTLDWGYEPNYNRHGANFNQIPNIKIPGGTMVPNALCSKYKIVSSSTGWANRYTVTAMAFDATFLRVYNDGTADAATYKIAMSGVQLCYELAEPLIIQLTPNQVNSLLGVNNLWVDSGDTEVEYRADTKLYIERLTAPDSVDMIADANITSGQYFMVGNSLYKATANIANGGQIIVGTNATRVSLAQALNEINV